MQKKHITLSAIVSSLVIATAALLPSWLLTNTQTNTAFAAGSTARYNIGSPTFTDIWISPNGNDANPGTQSAPLLTLARAWQMIPANQTLATGYRVRFMAGTYNGGMPNYMENRLGTANAPVVLQAEGDVQINGNLNIYNVKYFYIVGLKFTSPHDVIHFEKSDHVLLRNVTLRSNNRAAQETVKINQSQYVYIEDSDISGAWDNAIDFVAVQHGHIVGNKVHDANDWCMYTKGGSAYFTIEGNEIYNCGTGGYTAGQGTGVQFMTAPWVQYEAYDIKFFNNIIHNTEGAGIGVNGGYNILMAHNTMYKVGTRDHVIEVVFGLRGCDGGDTTACNAVLNAGGWGSTSPEEGLISNKNVYIYNNIVYNPTGVRSQWTQFAVYAPRNNTVSGFRGPSPAVTDTNLQIKGNIIWNGPNQVTLGLGNADEGNACLSSNPTCNPTQVARDNAINTIEPQFANAAAGNFSIPSTSNIYSAVTFAIPTFSWSDATNNVPAGNLINTVTKDFYNNTRNSIIAGAFTGNGSAPINTSISTPASTPSSTPSSTPASTPSSTPTSTPSASSTPRSTPSSTPTSSPSSTPSSTPRASSTPASSPNTSSTLKPDLLGYWNNIDTACRTRSRVTTCTMNSDLIISNDSDKVAPKSKVYVYLSTNNAFDSNDVKIKELSAPSLGKNAGKALAFRYSSKSNYRDTPYLIAVFDPTNAVSEKNENNNYAISPIF